jgi:hypothetical protein
MSVIHTDDTYLFKQWPVLTNEFYRKKEKINIVVMLIVPFLHPFWQSGKIVWMFVVIVAVPCYIQYGDVCWIGWLNYL